MLKPGPHSTCSHLLRKQRKEEFRKGGPLVKDAQGLGLRAAGYGHVLSPVGTGLASAPENRGLGAHVLPKLVNSFFGFRDLKQTQLIDWLMRVYLKLSRSFPVTPAPG